jgi:tetratricopeptide (TPR) repeat protein
MKKAGFLFLPVLLFLSAACTTTGYKRGTAGLNGMVYDFDNKPVPQYIIEIDGKNPASTDINGRFFIPRVRSGKHEIRGRREGYEEYRGEIIINDKRQIVYLRVPSLSQLLNLADNSLSKNNVEEAALYIERGAAIGEKTVELLFYSAIVLFRKGEYQAAVESLRDAVSRGSRDEYVTRFLNELTKRYGE